LNEENYSTYAKYFGGTIAGGKMVLAKRGGREKTTFICAIRYPDQI
jgi:hypothetical protein